jgi:hypothetical protein
MSMQSSLTPSELISLKEVSRGPFQAAIPQADGSRLLQLKLVYKMLGELRITMAGRDRLRQ